MTQSYEVHKIANIFPAMADSEFQALKADIAKHGQREPVWLYQGKIVDGRHRARAMQELGKEPRTQVYDGFDAVAFVVSLNLHRRHMTESQRAISVAKAAAFYEKGGDRRSADFKASNEALKKTQVALKVSDSTLDRARKVVSKGAEELIAAVSSGDVSVSVAANIADQPIELQRELVAKGRKEILQAAKEIRAVDAEVRRAVRIEKIVEISKGNAPLGQIAERYPVLYADPPWRYDYAESDARVIENHYPTMDLAEIKALPVDTITTDDCILFLWATSPKLQDAMDLLKAWGFGYRTCAIWDKQKIGMGYYFRQQHELLLIACKGAPPTPRPADRPGSVFSYPRGPHSAKPLEVYEIIEAMYPELPKLEMFCRSPRDGWGVWGNQSEAA